MKYVTIFCSAADLDKKYTVPAIKFARLLAKQGYHLVWGGSDTGLMKLIANTVQSQKGKLIGVSVTHFRDVARKNADKMIFTKSLSERKVAMLERCDAVAVLVGGTGTLDEATDVIEMKKVGDHQKPIVFLNTDNYYRGLKMQLKKMKDDGFMDGPISELIHFSDEPEDAIAYINEKVGENEKARGYLKNRATEKTVRNLFNPKG